jgi:hypothetical protein
MEYRTVIFDAILDPRSSIGYQSSFCTPPGYASLPACCLDKRRIDWKRCATDSYLLLRAHRSAPPAARSERAFASQFPTVHDCTLEAMRTQLHSHRAAKTPRAYSSILNIAKADECNYISSHHETWRYYQPAHLGRIVVSSLPMAKLTTCTRKR